MVTPTADMLIWNKKRGAMYYSSSNELINICSRMSWRKVQEVGNIPALSGCYQRANRLLASLRAGGHIQCKTF